MSDYQGVAGSGIGIDQDDIGQTITFRDGPLAQIDVSAGYTAVAKDCGKLLVNVSGGGAASARPVNLPTPAVGLWYRAIDMTANGLRLVATGGATIYSGISGSSANGYIETTIIRQTITLYCPDGVNWLNMRDDQSNLNIG